VEKAPLSSTPFLALKSKKWGRRKRLAAAFDRSSEFRCSVPKANRATWLNDRFRADNENLLVQDGAIDQNAKENLGWWSQKSCDRFSFGGEQRLLQCSILQYLFGQ